MAAASSSSSPCVPLERIAGATPSRPDPTSVYRSALTGKHILVTGGLGYIGSHTCVELIQTGARVTIVDNLYNAHAQVLNRIQYLTGIIDDNICKWINVDLRNMAELEKVFSSNHFDAVIHFAGLKAVGESVDIPLKYWDYNINGALNLFHLMEKYNCKSLVFSSSATVYGNQTHCPITETASLSSTNPYGATKLTIENICRDIEIGKEKGWAIALLRYFNPIGAHPTGLIGEDPKGIPNNLVPFVTQVAVGKRPHVNVFGSDYPTVDGTGVRDYIHVVDLARGHLAALANAIFSKEWKEKLSVEGGANIVTPYNLGTGSGSSVLEVIAAVKSACGREVPYKIAPRRAGGVATCYSDPSKAQKELLWKTEFSLQDAINHSWKWQSSHPDGYLTPNIQLK